MFGPYTSFCPEAKDFCSERNGQIYRNLRVGFFGEIEMHGFCCCLMTYPGSNWERFEAGKVIFLIQNYQNWSSLINQVCCENGVKFSPETDVTLKTGSLERFCSFCLGPILALRKVTPRFHLTSSMCET